MQGHYPLSRQATVAPSAIEATVAPSAIEIEGSTKANFTQAVELYKKGDFSGALPLFESSATQNIANAYYYLGVIFEKGLGVESNPAKAHEHYVQAIKLNDETSKKNAPANPRYLDKYHLGCLLEAGYTTESSINCINCYLLASNAGNPHATLAIASLMDRDVIPGKGEAADAFRNLAASQFRALDNK